MKLGLLPKYSDRLLALRLDGKDPAELVIVSLDGLQTEYIDNYQMVCDVRKQYDWRLLAGLEVCLLIRASIPSLMDFMLDMAKGIRPGRLHIWDIDSHMGASLYALPTVDSISRPAEQWKWELDCIAWLPKQNEDFLHGPRQLHQGLPRHLHVHTYNQKDVAAA
jgi:hypothetical protein